jgi:hypothetical protein
MEASNLSPSQTSTNRFFSPAEFVSRRMAVSFPEGEIVEATTSGDTSWEGDAITVNVPLDLLDFTKNVLLVVLLAFRVLSCEVDTTWMTGIVRLNFQFG